MALRYAILGLLTAEPMSGYDLSKWMDRGLSNIWSAHASQIYPELARLVEDGSIEEVPGEPGPRRRRVYGITDAGTGELREWLAGPRPELGARSEALLHAVLLGELDDAEAEAALGEAATRHRERATLNEALRAQASQPGSALAPLRLAFDCGVRIETALAEWAEAARAERAPRRTPRSRPARARG
jgi:PadR family transcriptional regulator, regulatory protein AphA